jgi:hypothetical protein
MPSLSDLTKLILISEKSAFKNNAVYEDSVNITGNATAGLNVRDFTVPLDRVPDLLSFMVNGPTDTVYGSDPRPGNAWFKKGYVWVLGTDAGAGYIDYPVPWSVTVRIQGQNAIIHCEYVQQFIANLALTSTPLNYRIIDYSVF